MHVFQIFLIYLQQRAALFIAAVKLGKQLGNFYVMLSHPDGASSVKCKKENGLHDATVQLTTCKYRMEHAAQLLLCH